MRHKTLSGIGKLLLAAAIAAVANYAVAAQSPAPLPTQTESEWYKFSPPEGRFSVLLPHEPKFEAVKAGDSQTVTNYRYSDLENGYGFICEYFDVDQPGSDMDTFLDTIRDAFLHGAEATKLSEEKISLSGYPGRMITLSLLANGHEVTGESRIFVVGKRVYSLSFLRLKDANIPNVEANARKFFSSLELKPEKP